MKTIFQITAAMTFAIGISGICASAFATDTRQAIKLCDANPNCQMLADAGGDKITMVVKGNGGNKSEVECPKLNGPCVAYLKSTKTNDDSFKRSKDAASF